MKYRPDIDGLRAIAVLSVVFYHANLSFFSGGFVGVDIFFVISGYLITSIITNEIQDNRFSLANFYERRIRRIFPALFVVVGFSCIASYLILFPSDFVGFGKSLISTILFASNMLFWHESGYFDASSLTKPLLHTWSLGVEEQYYILFPVLLTMAHRWVRFHWAYVLVPVGAISFVLAIFFIESKPSLVFYWTPTRAWELFLGAFLALRLFPEIKNKLIIEVISLIGMLMIAIAVFLFSEKTVFPAYMALFPCLGAGLLIYAGGLRNTFVTRALSRKTMVFIGLISYSLYLWHWPLFVFYKSLTIEAISSYAVVLLLIVSLACAYLSWQFVEKPFRKRGGFESQKNVFLVAFIFMAVFVCVGMFIVSSDGMKERFPPSVLKMLSVKDSWNPKRVECFGSADHPKEITQECIIGDPFFNKAKVFLWGDSHADAFYGAFQSIYDNKGISTIYAADASCPPLLGLGRTEACIVANDRKLLFIKNHESIEYVVLVARWSAYLLGGTVDFGPAERHKKSRTFLNREGQAYVKFSNEEKDAYAAALKNTIEGVLKLNKKIILVYPVPEVGYSVPETLARLKILGEGDVFARPYSYYKHRHEYITKVLNAYLKLDNVFSVHPDTAICEGQSCYVSRGKKLMYRDDDHLSINGAALMAPLFLKVIE